MTTDDPTLVLDERPRWRRRLENVGSTGIVVGVQLLGLAALIVRPSPMLLGLAALTYASLVFGIVAGYHRGLSHRAFETSRPVRFALAWLGTAAMQNGPVWWVSWHRTHHRHSDQLSDPHSPVQRGVLQAHIGWVLDGSHDHPDTRNASDIACVPELAWLDRWKWVPVLVHAGLSVALLGLPGLVWAFALPTTLAFHAPLFVNSLGHVWGTQRHATRDGARNNALLALVSLGDGWHNNHHHAPRSARAGERWWELDPTYWMISGLALLGLVWDVRTPVAPGATLTRPRR